MVKARLEGDPRGEDFQRNVAWGEERLALGRDRHQSLAGVPIDRKDHSLVFGGRYLRLTRREADLLDFLIRHPGRHFTTRQLTILAWQNSRLSDAQVRTSMMRLRRRLGGVGLSDIITIFRNQGDGADLPR